MYVMRFLLLTVAILWIAEPILIRSAAAQPMHDECNPPKELLRQWQRSIYGLPEHLWKPLPGCPGFDDEEPGVANFTFSQTAFRIPRDVLGNIRNFADGASNDITVRLFYPQLTYATGPTRLLDTIDIAITGFKTCSSPFCIPDIDHWLAAHIDSRFTSIDDVVKIASKAPESDVNEKSRYLLPDGRTIYVHSSLASSKFWTLCLAAPIERCETYVYFRGGAIATVRFNGLKSRRDQSAIRASVVPLLSRWCDCQPLEQLKE